jgi:Flp pilus assembly protein TadG
MVEFAIVLPLLLIVVFGIISFGFIFNHKLSLTEGAREAGRFGATLPVTNFATAGDPMQEWLDAITSRVVADTTGSLDPGVSNRTICVAYVFPSGTAGMDETRRRLEAGGTTTYSNEPCFVDGRPNDERRVQVRVGRDAKLEAVVFSMTIPLTADSVTRFEASLVAS